MHQEVLDFFKRIKEKYPHLFKGKRVLEFGGLNINGSVRDFFENCEYISVDMNEGNGVDVVCLAHEFKDKNGFDVIVSTEMLEHDRYADLSVANAWRLLRPDGAMIFTCANINREPHCLELGFYRNISANMVYSWAKNLAVPFYSVYLEEDKDKKDLRFIFFK